MLTASSNQKIKDPFLDAHEVELFIKREDLLHPYISGNKFRKLKYNLQEAKAQQKQTLLTFGGAYSNHIHATAFAGKKYNFNTIGIIRGEELGVDLEKTLTQNSTLAFAAKQGMHLHFVSRNEYRNKDSTPYLNQLKKRFGNFYLLPEGGTNTLAIKGCTEILTLKDHIFSHICCAVGTGGTISGIINSAQPHQQLIGFSVLKENYLAQAIAEKVNYTNWELNKKHHLGGYAKTNTALISFINTFYKNHKILLDPIYTGKLIFGIYNEIATEKFPKKSRILAIHTGGLQGITGINTRLKKKQQQLIETDYEF